MKKVKLIGLSLLSLVLFNCTEDSEVFSKSDVKLEETNFQTILSSLAEKIISQFMKMS